MLHRNERQFSLADPRGSAQQMEALLSGTRHRTENLAEELRRVQALLPPAMPFHVFGVAVAGQSQKACRLHKGRSGHFGLMRRR